MASSSASAGQPSTSAAGSSSKTSGLSISLHPLPILSISEHYTRSSLQHGESRIIIGALLGTQTGREVAVVNTFELVAQKADVSMDTGGADGAIKVDADFLQRRSEQFKQVFPTLDLVGWYTVGDKPDATHVQLQRQFQSSIESPILLLLSPSAADSAATSSDLPLALYESALGDDGEQGENTLIQLEYTINTGEAERIAVEMAAKAGDDAEDSGLVQSLTTQRNAIQMLYDRMQVLLGYVSAVIAKQASPDDALLRDISAVVATLPTMQTQDFREEFMTEHSDVQLTQYLSALTKSLAELNDLTDKFNVVHERKRGEDGNYLMPRGHPAEGQQRPGGGRGRSFADLRKPRKGAA